MKCVLGGWRVVLGGGPGLRGLRGIMESDRVSVGEEVSWMS